MATSKVFVISMFIALLFVGIASQKPFLEPEDAISSLRIELEQLKTKVSILESTIEKSNHELQSKDDDIKQMENIILEKSRSIASLQNKVEALQKGSLDAKGEANGQHPHVAELEKQVDRIKKEIETQETRKVGLKAQANIAEKKIQELNLNLENKVSYEQKTRIHKTEQALQVAEEEMGKAEPAATFMKSLKTFVMTHWKNFWRPALDASFLKIQVKLSQVRKDGEMCIEMLKTEWIPVMKDQWLTFLSSVSSHVESLTAKTIEAYHVTKNSLLYHTAKIQKAAAPFILEAHKSAKHYINQIETVTKPYIDKAVVTLEPFSRKLVCAYRMFVTSAISYHKQAQEMLKTNELTRSLASMELAWFAATALLCLPVVFLFRLYSAIFRKRTRKSRYISYSNKVRRKLKRPHNID